MTRYACLLLCVGALVSPAFAERTLVGDVVDDDALVAGQTRSRERVERVESARSPNNLNNLLNSVTGDFVTRRDGSSDAPRETNVPNLMTPQQFVSYLSSVPVTPTRNTRELLSPPLNRIKVIDTKEYNRLTPEQKDRLVVYQTVVRYIQYQVQIPVYEDRWVVAYPCCCNVRVSVFVGYETEWRTRVEIRQEPAGTNFPTQEMYVDRRLYYENGQPNYTTQIPQLCPFHYTADERARLTAELHPVIPVRTNQNDQPPDFPNGISLDINSDGFEWRITGDRDQNGDQVARLIEPIPDAATVDRGSNRGDFLPLDDGALQNQSGAGAGVNTHAGNRTEIEQDIVAYPAGNNWQNTGNNAGPYRPEWTNIPRSQFNAQ